MYKLTYVDASEEITFYNDEYIDDEFVVIDPNLDLDVASGGSGPLTFTVPPSNIAYDKLQAFRTEIKCYKNGKEIWSGRITDIDSDFYNNQSITCEGEFAYLNDTCQPQKEYYNVTLRQFVESIINTHNAKVTGNGQGPINRRFEVGYISPTILQGASGDIIIPYLLTEYESTMDCINNNILTKYNCYIRVRKVYNVSSSDELIKPIVTNQEHYLTTKNGNYLQYGSPVYPYVRYIDLITEDEFDTNQTQSITFGENLLDFAKHYSITDLCSVVVATGEAVEEKGVKDEVETLCPTNRVGLVNKTVLIVNKDENGNEFVDWKRNYPGIEGYDPRDTNTSSYKVTQDIAVNEDDIIYLTTRLPKAGYMDKVDVYTKKKRKEKYIDPVDGKEKTREVEYIEHTVKTKQYAFCIYYFRDGNNANSKVISYKGTTKVGDEGFADSIKLKITVPKGAKVFNASWWFDENKTAQDVEILVTKAIKTENSINKYVDISGASGSLMISDKEIDGKAPHIGRLTMTQYEDDYSEAEKMIPSEWWYIKDRDMLVNQEKVYKRGIYAINPDALEKYGWMEKSLSLSDIKDNEELFQYASDYVLKGQWANMTLEITAFDLSMMGVNVDDFSLYTSINVNSKPHGVDRLFPLTKMSIPLQNPESTTFNLGDSTEKSLTETTTSSNQKITEKLQQQPKMNDILKSAFDNAAALINTANNGTVTKIISDEGAEEIIIHDGPKTEDGYRRAKNVWRWNIKGLGHGSSPTGALNEAYNMANLNIAMTMNGEIDAKFITTGILSALLIRGCDLRLGNYGSDKQGSVLVQNGDGTNAFQIGDPTQGAFFSSRKHQYFEYPNTTDAVRIVDGEIYFSLSAYRKSMTNAWSNVTTILNGRTRIENDEGEPYYGGSVKSENFTIAADRLWIDRATNPHGLALTKDGNIEIGTKRLALEKGMVVGVDDISNPPNKNYKVPGKVIQTKNGSIVNVVNATQTIDGQTKEIKPQSGTITVGKTKYKFYEGILVDIITEKEEEEGN